MNNNKILFKLIPIFLMLTATMNIAFAQQERFISGRITDAEDNEPVIGASVFFDNTTIGTTTDANGQYRLKIPGQGSYRLTVSHVGYQTVFRDIEPGNSAVRFDIALQSIELEELDVATRVRFRQTDINLFWKTILGKNPSRRTIQATNPETVYYYYNPETRILKVTCREPLQIVNYETGYQIQYFLNYFTHDYNSGFTDWHYQSAFTELEPQNPRQKDNWEKNRKEVYDISLTKFIKSLYNNTLLNDGFVLANFDLSLVGREEILQTNSITNSKTIYTDGLILLICYGKPLTDRDHVRLQSFKQTSQQTTAQTSQPSESIGVTVVSEIQRSLSKERRESNRQLREMENIIARYENEGKIKNMLQGDSIRIFPDGTFTNTLSMGSVNNSASLMGLSMRLPTEYVPETVISDVIVEKKNDFDVISQHFAKQLSVFPQEKIHLHTDRNYYVPGEKIWFNAYVTDATTNQYTTNSRYVYVELISPVDTLISRVMIRPENDMYYGHLFLSELIPEGNYTLRAYTRYMENLGDDYFFKKNIRIGNLTSNMSPKSQSSQNVQNRGNRGSSENRGNRNLTDDFDVTFFPEGGNLVEGVWNKVAFKALNRNGYPETITGIIVDESGAEITSVQTFHAGMGVFVCSPEQGKRYYLKCRNGNGLEKQFMLPIPALHAYTLTASQQNKRILVRLRKSTDTPSIPCYLLAHCRGTVLYFDLWNQKNEAVVFSEEELPSGIIQFVLFDEQMNPLSERLVFNKNFANDVSIVEFQTDKTSYEKREKVIATISEVASLTPSLSERGQGVRCSIAITDDADIAVDSTTTILSSLLLSSELKGYIENPAWYLQDNIQSVTALDYLMMTHGWRRYNIPEVVKGNPETPKIPFQASQQLSGKVRGLFSRPVSDSEVLIVTEAGEYGLTTTDEKGSFMFQDFEYPDSSAFMIQALSRRGNNNVELVVDEESFPTLIHAPFVEADDYPSMNETDNNSSLRTDAFIVKAEQRSRYDEDKRVIHLSEIVVTAPRIEQKVERRLEFWANRSSDYTIRREEIARNPRINVADYLTFIPGVQVNVDPVDTWKRIIRICALCGSPLILVDGIPGLDINELVDSEVESIDVLKFASTSVFGTRGMNGVVSITTRRGGEENEIEKFNQTIYTPLGYQKPVEFYSPKYETLESKYLAIPDYRTTIFWKPDIVITDEQEEISFEFYTSDYSTTYSVVIEGITTDGKIVRQLEKIRVE